MSAVPARVSGPGASGPADGPSSGIPSRLRRLAPPTPLPEGFDAVVHGMVGWFRRSPWQLRTLRRQTAAIADAMVPLSTLSDAALRERLAGWREAFRCAPRDGRGSLCETLAGLGETAFRSLGLRPFPVQFMGGLALHAGLLAEMATGEGKTLTAALPAILAAWSGRPCHVVTANDYLAARDAEAMAPLYAWCGVSVASITGDLPPDDRAARYHADVVYITAKELLGDFLRDRLATGGGPDPARIALTRWLAVGGGAGAGGGRPQPIRLLQVRGLDTAIVDEADSILIDEAVTPLILAAPRDSQQLDAAVRVAAEVAAELVVDRDYRAVSKQKAITLRPGGQARMAAEAERLPILWRAAARREELLRQALVARHFLHRDQQYVVQDGKVVLLDEFTGRMTPGRTLSAGLHQAIEAAEELAITQPTETLAQMSFQTFFRHFRRLSGMTGTAAEAAGELWAIYRLAVLAIPTNRPCRRQVAAPVLVAEEEAKWRAVLAEIERRHATGQPILVGTRSVRASERLAHRLEARGLRFELLNAVRHQEEARIVAGAGHLGRITIATNMAGRGTDIKLGPGAAALGGLHVIATESHESGRIDRQLVGRCARQGDPGSVTAFLSFEDEVVVRFLPGWLRRAARILAVGGAGPARLAFRLAQRRAEAQAFGRRRAVLQADSWLDNALPEVGG